MKKILLSSIALCAAATLSAQESDSNSEGFKKGDTFISGNASFRTQKDDVSKGNGFGISPSVGYFVSDNIALGASIGYQRQKNEVIASGNEQTNNYYNAGLFGRYYFTPEKKFSFFGDLNVNYYHNEAKNSTSSIKSTGNGFSVQAGPGINYFLNERFALQTFVGALTYGSSKTGSGSTSNKTTGFEARINLSNITFGITYKL